MSVVGVEVLLVGPTVRAPRNCCSGWGAANVSVTSPRPAKKLAVCYLAPAKILYSASTTYRIGACILS